MKKRPAAADPNAIEQNTQYVRLIILLFLNPEKT